MMSLVPEVHLFICLDPRISPGPILHLLDVARAQDWQQETVLICDESWKPFVNIDQPVLFIDRDRVFGQDSQGAANSLPYLENFLEQLDNFEIQHITQIGNLSWGRWLEVYFDSESSAPMQSLNWEEKQISSLQIINDLAQELGLDLGSFVNAEKKSSGVYIDPYVEGKLSQEFLKLVSDLNGISVPSWLSIVCQDEDVETLSQLGLEDCLVEPSECETSLFNQPVFCFSDQSMFAHTSRAYNIAIYKSETENSLFVPGDISIEPNTDIHISEIFNILAYWRTKRLKELAFQWLNMGIKINCIENFYGRAVRRNLLNYSSDLYHCQILIDRYLTGSSVTSPLFISSMIYEMRQQVNNDPYALSFSLKLLIMILDRMISAAKCGERLFGRLGSDYHRIIIGEALIEGLIETSWSDKKVMDISKKLQQFHGFLTKVDFANDQMEAFPNHKESA